MYATVDFKTKKAFKQAVKDGLKIGVFSPGPYPAPDNGSVGLEGPHYPKPHTWYASARVEDGIITKVT